MAIKELPGITRFIPKIVLAITVTVCDEVYKKIAHWLNDMGKNHVIEHKFLCVHIWDALIPLHCRYWF